MRLYRSRRTRKNGILTYKIGVNRERFKQKEMGPSCTQMSLVPIKHRMRAYIHLEGNWKVFFFLPQVIRKWNYLAIVVEADFIHNIMNM